MIQLCTQNINTVSPYKVEKVEKEGVYEFFTDYGIHYYVDFTEDDLLQSAMVYQFSIINVNNIDSPRDWKVRETILAIIDEFFLNSKSALLYICETGDGKQSMRSRLFQSWFNKDRNKNDFFIMTADIEDDGVINYAAIIVPLDAPMFEQIVNEFREMVTMLKNKP